MLLKIFHKNSKGSNLPNANLKAIIILMLSSNIKRKKLQTNIPFGYRQKNTQQNNSKRNINVY